MHSPNCRTTPSRAAGCSVSPSPPRAPPGIPCATGWGYKGRPARDAGWCLPLCERRCQLPCRKQRGHREGGLVVYQTAARCLAVEGFNGALELDQDGLTTAIQRLGGGDLHPTFADAVLLDIGALFAVQANTDRVLEAGGHIVRAAGIAGEVIRQSRFGAGIAHRYNPK